MQQIVSRSQFIAKISKYLRIVETQKQTIVITDNGKPVIMVFPYKEESSDKQF